MGFPQRYVPQGTFAFEDIPLKGSCPYGKTFIVYILGYTFYIYCLP